MLAPNHPKQKLLFHVAQDIDETCRRSVKTLLQELAVSRSWAIAAPCLVDSTTVAREGSGDEPIETLGGVLEIYAARGKEPLPADVDRQQFEETKALVQAIKDLSAREGLVFEFELDGVYVGAVEDGKADRLLQVGLLDEWGNALKSESTSRNIHAR